MSEFVEKIRSLDPKGEEFGQLVDIVAERAEEMRNKDGILTYPLFKGGLRIQGIYSCIELLVLDLRGVLHLRQRQAEENVSEAEASSWNRLHIPGTAVRPTLSLEDNIKGLILREVVRDPETSTGKENAERLYRTAIPMGLGIYPEPERSTDAFTVFYGISADVPDSLRTDFAAVSFNNLHEVITQHQPAVKRILRGQLPLFFDSRQPSNR